MATKGKQKNSNTNLISLKGYTIAVIISEWNSEITLALKGGVEKIVKEYGGTEIIYNYVPGAFELPLAGQWYAEMPTIDGVICLGCVINGETPHFDFICHACAEGITKVGLKSNKPVIFGVLTTNTQEQARQRAGLASINGRFENKGEEAAISLIKMLGFKQNISKL